MYPTSDAPLYKPAFTSNCVILGTAIATYLALPYSLYREARSRKLKTGHAMPLRAMEDAGMHAITHVPLPCFYIETVVLWVEHSADTLMYRTKPGHRSCPSTHSRYQSERRTYIEGDKEKASRNPCRAWRCMITLYVLAIVEEF
jgi:hypothetical protein